ncbi:hypothetical protein HDU84_008518, partial [Entophlyctis sp. JEL0112]
MVLSPKAKERIALLNRIALSARNPEATPVTIGELSSTSYLSLIDCSDVTTVAPRLADDPLIISRKECVFSIEWRYEGGSQKRDLLISIPVRKVDPASLFAQYSGFLNTGNVRIWGAEYALAYWICKHSGVFRDRKVLELGAGMTGLAGLSLAATGAPAEVVITDGNPSAVANIEENIIGNSTRLASKVSASQLLWGAVDSEEFDIIIGSETTFLVEYHQSLVQTLKQSLKLNTGTAYFLCAARGSTLDAFLETLENSKPQLDSVTGASFKLVFEKQLCYDEEIWERHNKQMAEANGNVDLYNVDKEYPVL